MPEFVDHLCYRHATADEERHLCYKYNRSLPPLVYKSYRQSWAQIIVTWGSAGKDLDLCGYWLEREDGKVGWSWANAYENGLYRSIWESGDVTSAGGKEKIYVAVFPDWSSGSNLKYRVHLNYYGYDSEEHPGTTCTVTVKSNGFTLTKSGVACGTVTGSRATTDSPFVTITFSPGGTPLRVE